MPRKKKKGGQVYNKMRGGYSATPTAPRRGDFGVTRINTTFIKGGQAAAKMKENFDKGYGKYKDIEGQVKKGQEFLSKASNMELKIDKGTILKLMDMATETGTSNIIPVLTTVATAVLSSGRGAGGGKRQGTLTPSQAAMIRNNPTFGQSAVIKIRGFVFGDAAKSTPRGRGIRRTETDVYQGKYTNQIGQAYDSGLTTNLETGFNVSTSRFNVLGAASLPERMLRNLLSPISRFKPNEAVNNGFAYFDQGGEKNDQSYSQYSPFSVKSDTMCTNINSTYSAKVTAEIYQLVDNRPLENSPLDELLTQFTSIPDSFKINEGTDSSPQVLLPQSLSLKGDSTHQVMGMGDANWSGGCDVKLISGKTIDSANIKSYRKVKSTSVMLDPGQTALFSVVQHLNENFAMRGLSTDYPDDYNYNRQMALFMVVRVEGQFGSVYSYRVTGDQNNPTRTWMRGTLPVTLAMNTKTSIVNYWEQLPLRTAGDQVDPPSMNSLYSRTYQSSFFTEKVNLPKYNQYAEIVGGEIDIPSSAPVGSEYLIVPASTTKTVVAAGLPMTPKDPIVEA
jgi:hypothetical protein